MAVGLRRSILTSRLICCFPFLKLGGGVFLFRLFFGTIGGWTESFSCFSKGVAALALRRE